jgi:zinc protease
MRTENQAEGVASEALNGLAFMAHPYRNPIVGWPRDVARLKQEDALAYFRTYYHPANCIMVFVGDVKAAEIERLARKYFGGWPRQEMAPPVITAEPDQKGERRAVIEFDAQPSLYLAWRTVPQGHADQYALDVLANILGGLYSSRLDKSIVQEERIASWVGSYHHAQKQGGCLGVMGYLAPNSTLADLEAAIDREIGKLRDGGVTAEELERAKIGVEVSQVRSLKSNIGQAFRIGEAVGLAGTPDYLAEAEARLNAVTAADVLAVARRYLAPNRKCVVEVRKTSGASGASSGPVADVHHRGGGAGERGAKHSKGFEEAMAMSRSAPTLDLNIPEIGKDVDRVVLESGVTVFIKEDHSAPSVEMRFVWLGGSNTTPLQELAPFAVASQLFDEGGTETLDPMALQEKKEQLGLSLHLWFGETQSGAWFWSLKRNFADSFGLTMDMVMRPRFDGGRLETIKRQYIDEMRRRYDYPSFGSSLIQKHVLYHDNPRLGYEPSKAEVQAVTPEDIRRIWQRYLGRDNLYVTVVGDFDKKEVLDLLQTTFAPWRTAQDKQRDFHVREPVIRPGLYVVEKEVSAPSVNVMHQIKVDRTAPIEDHAALEILNDILGGSGFRSRLMERLRSDEGLTYGIYSFLAHDARPGVPGEVEASYETKQLSVARSIDSVVEEFRKIAQGKVSPAEVQEQIEAWRNRFVFKFTNDFYSVNRLMQKELDDRPYDWDRRILDAVQKVTPADVERVAAKYLRPEDLTICIFGSQTAPDRQALAAKYPVTVLPKSVVFRGGFDEPAVDVGKGDSLR